MMNLIPCSAFLLLATLQGRIRLRARRMGVLPLSMTLPVFLPLSQANRVLGVAMPIVLLPAFQGLFTVVHLLLS